MSEKRIIYVVTSGSYSNYGIAAVFDRRDLAEAMVAGKADGYDGYQIEEYPINPGEAEYHAGRSLWQVQMRRDGSVRNAWDLGFAHELAEEPKVAYDGSWPNWTVCLQVETWSRDQEQAVKATNEVRARWIAEGRWDREEADVKAKYPR